MAVLCDFDRSNINEKTLNGPEIPLSDVDNYSDAMSTDSEELDIQQELRNIENVISLTRTNIDALNAKFADFQQPPAMYLKEYEDLTSKLHELEVKRRRLMEQLSNGRESPEDLSDQCYSTHEQNKPHYDTLTRPKFLRAHLPNQQRTSVQVREGLTLREALAKAMKLRNLVCEICCVYLGDSNIPINWDTDIFTLNCEEITVKIIDKFPIPPTSISHNFVRKTFFSLVFCECCRRLLFQGFYCRTCGYKFHQRCAARVPSLCHQVRMADAYYRALLARPPDSCAGILHAGTADIGLSHRQARHPGTLGHHDRSSSAPNVCLNSVKGGGDDCSRSGGEGNGSPHCRSTQASPTGSLQPRRPRARSADESKPLLAPRESIEDWEIPADEILVGARVGSG
nr:unnamed protein product [Callosobruchus analis]